MGRTQSRLGANRPQLWKVCHHQSNRCKSRSTVSPRPSQKQRPTGVEIGGNIGGQPLRTRRGLVSPPPIPPAVYGYYALASIAAPSGLAKRGRNRRPQPQRSPAPSFATTFP